MPECRCMICHDQDKPAPVLVTLMDDIAERGWGVVVVPTNGVSDAWAFTVGLWHTYGSPELAVFGMDPDSLAACLDIVAKHVTSRKLVAGDQFNDVLDDDRWVTLRAVHESWPGHLFGTCLGFYRTTQDLPFLQLVWPDLDGRFPGDQGFDEDLSELQPHLWLPRDDHAPGPWTSKE